MAALTNRLGRRQTVFLGVGLALVLLAFAATRLMGGGEDPFADLSGAVAVPSENTPGTSVQLGASAPAPAGAPTGAAGIDAHDHSDDGPMRDPFCPLVSGGVAGLPAVSCPRSSPPPPTSPDQPAPEPGSGLSDQPMTLLDVFADGGHLHARAQIGAEVFTAHVNDTFDAYTVASLSGDCGEFVNGEERKPLCKGQEWGAAPTASSP